MAQRPDLNLSLIQRGAIWFARKTLGIPGVYSVADPKLVAKLTDSPINGYELNETSAMQISSVFTCVRILSESIGALPKAIFKKNGDNNAVQVPDHRLAEILIDAPNADMTSQECFEAKVANLALRGNTYSLKEFNGAGDIASLYPLPSCNVEPFRKETGRIYYRFTDRGKREEYPAEKIWHVKGFGSNGLMGLSPIALARRSMGLAYTMEEFGTQFFQNGARMSGMFKTEKWLSKEQRPLAKQTLQEMFGGIENAGKVGLLEGGMDFDQLTVPPEDAQFLESRGFQARQIFGLFRIPPHLAGDLERATFTNIEQQSQDFVQFTLLPYLVRFEQTVNRWLFSKKDQGKYFFRFNVEGLLRADSAARAGLYSVMLQNGVYTRNEVRALENKPKSNEDGMDDFTVQVNMSPIQKLGEATKEPEPNDGAAPAPPPRPILQMVGRGRANGVIKQ